MVSLSQILGMVNVLQLITFLQFLSITSVPANAVLFNSALQDAATFQIFSFDFIYEKVFTALYASNEESDMENPVASLVPIIVSFAIQVMLACFALVLRTLRCKKSAKSISRIVFWNGTLIIL